MPYDKETVFNEILDTMENKDMKTFAQELLKTVPAYFWNAPASSTGKYHPSYALGDGGLARHTVALVRILNHFFEMDLWNKGYTSRERDALRIAGIMHDTRKSGSQEDFERSHYTKFEHPLLAADVVDSFKGRGMIPDNEITLISNAIRSHMGQWNRDKRSSTVLPLPVSKYQKLLHTADYLASRKDIEMVF